MKPSLALLLPALALLAAPPFAGKADAAPPPAATASEVKNVSPDDAQKLLSSGGKVTVLDVRTPKEFAKGHIAGAQNVDFHSPDFAEKVAALDKSKPVLVHCAAGGRSTKALETMKGFPAVYHLNEGFNAWEKAGKPIEK